MRFSFFYFISKEVTVCLTRHCSRLCESSGLFFLKSLLESVVGWLKVFRKMFQALSLAVLIFLVGGALLMVGTRPFGLTPYVILSGSKEPSFPAGSIVYVKQIEPEQVRVGDAITFVLNEELEIATNRVVSIDEGGPYFYTVGDVDDDEDSTFVYFRNLLGIPQFSIPKLGYLAHAIASSPGNFIAMGSTVIFVFI